MAKGKFIAALLLAWTLGATAHADTLTLNPEHPDRYTVVRGDTLWDISSRFLRDPWRWPEIWQVNPAIENPHLIYPGDTIVLRFENGQPVLQLERAGQAQGEALPVVRLSPGIRSSDLTSAIPTIPMDAIQQFLTQSRIVDKDQIAKAPYVVSMEDGRLIGGANHEIYARKMSQDDTAQRYGIYRIGEAYHRAGAKKDDVLGYEAVHVGYAQVRERGDPATLLITDSRREALPGDRLFIEDQDKLDRNFTPHAPKEPVEGRIIAVPDAVSRVGPHQVVVVDLGKSDGVDPGLVLAVYQNGETIRDTVQESGSDSVKLPDTRAGVIMLFRTFDKVSYGLLMRASRDVRLDDLVKNP